MANRIKWITITLDREDAQGRAFQSTINIGPDGWSQSGEDVGDTVDLATAIFEAAADHLDAGDDEEDDDEDDEPERDGMGDRLDGLGEDEDDDGPDRQDWSVGDRAGAFDLGDRGEIVSFADGQDKDGFALAQLQLDYNPPGELVTVSVQSLSILTDD